MPSAIVPITPETNQRFTITLPVGSGNITLTFQLTWNAIGGYWFLSITDKSGNLLLDGVPVITGQYPAANVLRQYQYLGIGSAYLIPVSSGLPDGPDFSNLGKDYVLVWSDNVSV